MGMLLSQRLSVMKVWLLLLVPVLSTTVTVEAEGKTRKAYMPDWNDEESSTFNKDLPEKFKCDGCRGVAFMLSQSFAKREAEIGVGSKPLPESEFYHEIEETCEVRLEGKYGVKARNQNSKDKVFSGPGLKAYDLEDAQFGGMYWDKRIKKLCLELADSVGEEEIYAMYRDPSKNLAKAMCKRHCAKPKKPKKPRKLTKTTKAQTKVPKTKTQPAKTDSANKAGGSEIAKLRAENAKLKAALASCEAERDTVKKSLDDMIDIMDK